jgi:DNA (cytosine-5)-methyltransferase 1
MTNSQLEQETKTFIRHVKTHADLSNQLVFWIDLFCGAGGTSTGIHSTGVPNMFVAACVNHDKNAILSHVENHPNTLHFTEDIRNFEVVKKLKYLIDELRKAFPNCKINLWASLECTNFSNAKGGQPRDGDSRTHVYVS